MATMTAQEVNEMHDRFKDELAEGFVVHVWKGRNNHLRGVGHRTRCGQAVVAVVTGPPATERPLCRRCWS